MLAHQGVVDECWDDAIVPAIHRRFPHARPDELERAHAFAYGGSHIADLGYFPFGSRLFTDLLHYVRSGDFVATLVESAGTVDEYAFALGALSHYLTDDIGHPEATNVTVPELYPKLRKEYGDSVTYDDDHGAHLQTEFRFDVLQVARTKQALDLYRHAVAFEVSKPLLERAFHQTYGIGLDDLFDDVDVAIRTYRWAFREVVHEATGIAWELYRADIEAIDPTTTPAGYVYDLSRADFEQQFGKSFREPGYFAKFLAFLVKAVPNVGPFERLPYKPLPPEAVQRFELARRHIVDRYRTTTRGLGLQRPALPDDNLDTGRRTRRGEYDPADHAYETLLEKLDDRHFANVPTALRADILRFYEGENRVARTTDDHDDTLRRELAQLAAASADE